MSETTEKTTIPAEEQVERLLAVLYGGTAKALGVKRTDDPAMDLTLLLAGVGGTITGLQDRLGDKAHEKIDLMVQGGQNALWNRANTVGVAIDRGELDGTNPVAVAAAIRATGPEEFAVACALPKGKSVYEVPEEFARPLRLVQEGQVVVERPHVAHGPKGVPAEKADADYLRNAARNIKHSRCMGSNLTHTVTNLLHEAADAVESLSP